MNSEKIKELDKSKTAHTYSRYDVVLASGKGARCLSPEGKGFIDFTAGIGVNSLGFCDEGWIKVVTEQLNKIQHASNLFYTEPQARLAEALASRTGLSKTVFVNSGAEANETAIKAARKYGTENKGTGANRIITLKNSFHGRTMAALTATGQEKYHRYFTPFIEGFDYCAVNDTEELKKLADENSCAIMIEVIQGEGGVVDLNQDFAEAAEKICRDKDMLLIIDEVQTGIGRTGKLFAYQHYGLKPDIVTFAKGLGGGLPIGGAIMGEKCCNVLQPGDHGSTFGGNPVVCAGALEVLKRLDEDFLREVAAKGEYVKERLLQTSGVNGISGKGLMLGISLEKGKASHIVEGGIREGLLLLTAGEKVRLLPPLNIEWEELGEGLNIMKSLIKSITC
ncbi:MAG: acetylornithine/succinylornithine family transaminase [Clostridiales bacterium]|nr:acetylornithine/succinylornithine family transaminase [Clostridiales bacterium]